MTADSKRNGLRLMLLLGLFLFPALSPLFHPDAEAADVIIDTPMTLSDSQTIDCDSDEFIGYAWGQTGTLTQTGGTNTVSLGLYLGYTTGNTGIYQLSGGTVSSSNLVVGLGGAGAFTQTGGTNAISNDLILGDFTDGSGTFELSGGTLSSQNLAVGAFGTGTFTQTGGTNTVANNLHVGFMSGDDASDNVYDLRNGSLSSNSLFVGGYGMGSFLQSGGTNAVTADLCLGYDSTALGSYVLSGGTLSSTNLYAGFLGTGAFTQSGGVNTVSGYLFVGFGSAGTGSYTLSGGTLNAQIVYLVNGTFEQNGGRLNASYFFQDGGEVLGSLENRGTFLYAGGLFSGRLLNYGSIVLDSDFTAENGLANYSATPVVVDGGCTLTLNGEGLDNRGTFVVNGTLTGSGTLLNNTTGIFRGTGTVGGSFVNSGTVRPGNSIGTLNVVGSYTQTTTGNLEVEVSSTGNDRLDVIGTASLAGTVTPVASGSLGYTGRSFTFLTATDGVTGTFARSSGRLTPVVSWDLSYGSNGVDMLLSTDFAGSNIHLTSNQQSVGTALNALSDTASGDMATVLGAIANLPANSAVANSYAQISADKAASLSTLAFAGADLQKRILARRITDLRANESGSQTAGAASDSSASGSLFPKKGDTSGRWGIYFDPAVIVADKGSTRDQTGFDFSIAGFAVGIDCRLTDELVVGLSSGYNQTEADFRNSGGTVSGDTIPVSAYIGYFPGAFYGYGSLGYSRNLYDLHRNISFGGIDRTADSSPTGDLFSAYLEAGYEFRAGRLFVTPLASLSYSSLWVGEFTEENAGSLNLKVSSQHAESLQSGLGVKVSAPFEAGSIEMVPRVYATWQHEFSNGSRGLDARFSQAGPLFTFQTDAPGRDFGVFGTDLTMPLTKNLKVRMDYSVEAGAGDYTAHYVGADLRWAF